jgi:hypothetical protein
MPSGVVDLQRALATAPAALAVAWLALACEPTVVIGACSEPPPVDAGAAGAGASASEGALSLPWSTGFEDGLCGYHSVGGFCYARHGASLEVVESPSRRPGKFAAAFTVNANASTAIERSQTRCVIQGSMPKSAYYGAFYFIPALATSDGNWNLFHFLGGTSEADSHPLWDISLVNRADGKLKLSVLNFLTGKYPAVSDDVGAVPIGRWFQLQIKIVRSAQPNGEVIVLQDGMVALHLTDLITDDTEWGQWYVGNYVKTLVPALNTVYLDDITMSEGP